MSSKIWQSEAGAGLDPLVESYTVGRDYLLDQELLGYDIVATQAHAQMLAKIGILSGEEFQQLSAALDDLKSDWESGKFFVKKSQEDGHTAIEAYLTEKLGAVGRKIHTGRSRNDQSLVMMRLYLKDHLRQIQTLGAKVAQAFAESARRAGQTPMPGYTHLQKAMPTTVAMWLGSYADAFADMQALLSAAEVLVDQNPLGSAAGFGVSIPIDRELTTSALGFDKTQANPMYCGLSRGLFELVAVQALGPLMVLAGKLAHDMLLFTTEEFGFFSLPTQYTSGSSIMPHKQNYDLFEVMRGQSHTFGGYAQALAAVAGGIGSGYQRDLQLTKSTTMEAFSVTASTLEVLFAAVSALQIHEGKLRGAITGEMHSVSEINELVGRGVPFRDAYTQVKARLGK